MDPEFLKVVIIGDDEVSWALSQHFAHMRNEEKLVTTPQDTTLRTIQISAEKDETEEMTIEVFQRGGIETPNLLQLYCQPAQAFVITFSMNSRTSFDSIGKFMNGIVKANRKHCPIALVGMQKAKERLVVTLQEATNRAAELGVVHFHVQGQKFDQVMAPFVYLGHRHIQARRKPRRPLNTSVWSCQSVWNSAYSWIWTWTCFKRQQFAIERLEDTKTGEATTVYGPGEQPLTDSTHHQRRFSTSSVRTTIVDIDGQIFHSSSRQHRKFYLLEHPRELSSLQILREQTPWSVLYPRDKCSSEEFLQLAQSWPPDHPHMQGTPALYDIFRDIFRRELQYTISNFPAHDIACDQRPKRQCTELYRLMYMLLQDEVGSTIRVRINDHDLVSADGTTISDCSLTSVQLQGSSKVLLGFQNQSIQITFEVIWDDLWALNSFGIYMTVSADVADILPLWAEYPV